VSALRAEVRRLGPGCWAFAVREPDGGPPLVMGDADTWDEALTAAAAELRLFAAGAPDPRPPGVELPIAPPAIRGPITPGDATVPRGFWRRVLGL
jgi:hypothetical protein